MTEQDYRSKLTKLVKIINAKNTEIATLKSQLHEVQPNNNATINATILFHDILQEISGSDLLIEKRYNTNTHIQYVEVATDDFYKVLQNYVVEDDVANYKKTLENLGFVQPNTFSRGGAVTKVNGSSRRVVRIPRTVFSSFVGGDSNAES